MELFSCKNSLEALFMFQLFWLSLRMLGVRSKHGGFFGAVPCLELFFLGAWFPFDVPAWYRRLGVLGSSLLLCETFEDSLPLLPFFWTGMIENAREFAKKIGLDKMQIFEQRVKYKQHFY